MTLFLAGAMFGLLFAGAIFVIFITITRARPPARMYEPRWVDPFDEPPAPVVVTRVSVNRRREISL